MEFLNSAPKYSTSTSTTTTHGHSGVAPCGGQKGDHTQDSWPATSAVLHASLKNGPLPRVVSAKGDYLTLSDGRRILDATGGAAVACLGHGNERVQKAIAQQIQDVSYCYLGIVTTPATEDFSRLLLDSTNDEMSRVLVVNSGSEAMDVALKLARQFFMEKSPGEPQRVHFISRRQSYLGATLGPLAVGGHRARRALYEPLLSKNSSHVSPCYAYRDANMDSDGDLPGHVRRLEAELEAEFQRVGPANVAAFVAEPIVGNALGCVPPVPGYFEAVRRVCDRHGALLILDEIMSGCGRTGSKPTPKYPQPMHAWQDPLIGVVPDIMTMGKGLGGGYVPIAGVMANHRVIHALQKGSGSFAHLQTYQGHPLACRAALEVQRVIREDDLLTNVRKQGLLLETLLRQLLESHWAVGDIRGKGLFWGIELVADKATKAPFDPVHSVAQGIHQLAMNAPFNISILPGTGTVEGLQGDHIILAPPFTVSETDVQRIADLTAAVVNEYFRSFSCPQDIGATTGETATNAKTQYLLAAD